MLIIGNFRDVFQWIIIVVAFLCFSRAGENFSSIKVDFEIAEWYHNLFINTSPFLEMIDTSPILKHLDNKNRGPPSTELFSTEKKLADMQRHHLIFLDKLKYGNIAEKLAIMQLQILTFLRATLYSDCALVTANSKLGPFRYCREMALNLFDFSALDGQILSELIDVSAEEKNIIKKGYDAMYLFMVKYRSKVEALKKTKHGRMDVNIINIAMFDKDLYTNIAKEKKIIAPQIMNLLKLLEHKKLPNGKNCEITTHFEKLCLQTSVRLWENAGVLYCSSFREGKFDCIEALKKVQRNFLIELNIIDAEETAILDDIMGKKFNIKFNGTAEIKVEAL